VLYELEENGETLSHSIYGEELWLDVEIDNVAILDDGKAEVTCTLTDGNETETDMIYCARIDGIWYLDPDQF